MMNNMYTGIALAGNIITDNVKVIDSYPDKGMLSNIYSVSRAIGGCAANTAIDIANIDRSLKLSVFGRVGNDEAGEFAIRELKRYGVDTEGITVSDRAPTSFSDVMSLKDTGERTFFHLRGANAEFSPEHVPVSKLSSSILHIGYILLLDSFDKQDSKYGTVMAAFLKTVQDAGIRTSFDVVSDNTGAFARTVIPALKYTDNAIMNEIEACSAAKTMPRDAQGALIEGNIRNAMKLLLDYGVRQRVIVHCPECGFILNSQGEFTRVASLKASTGYIKGTVGAGDAFCAGCLYGIYNNYSDYDILRFAAGAAYCSLSEKDSISGMRSKEEINKIVNNI